MKAMVLTGHGDLDKLVWHEDWPVSEAGPGEVLVKVKACGLNNTDVNTRSGWYSKAVTEATTGDGYAEVHEEDPSWGGSAITFPRIQGADICGIIEAVGEGVDPARIGERVITDNWLRDSNEPENLNKTGYLGSEVNGGFAEYATLPSRNLLAVNSDYTDAELATFSCSYSTAEGMLTRANVGEADTVFVPGASGGVGGPGDHSMKAGSSPPYSEIKRLYVDFAYRGKAIASKLMAEIEQVAIAEGIAMVRLEIGVLQKAAIGLYKSLGYCHTQPFGSYLDDPLSLFMEKHLVPSAPA